MEEPHMVGFSPVAARIILASAWASARRAASGSAPMNAATLALLVVVLLAAIGHPPALPAHILQVGATFVSGGLRPLDRRFDDRHRLRHHRLDGPLNTSHTIPGCSDL